ncbi:MAG: ribosome biogenesis GTPase Der [Armatimonadetes bacterium]|nr:ribosome biogenesis GTPase Der [Armatimonadota bacterium]
MSASYPTVVIVGRPNVGKSTLFNRMAGRRIAVIDDKPGITRDRLYAECDHHGRQYQLVDTGGILFGDDDPLVEQIRVQVEVALSDADIVLFMVDADTGIAPADWDLAERLRGFDRQIIVVVNKVDSEGREDLVHEFHALGFENLVGISSIHGRGVDDLLTSIVEGLPKIGEHAESTALRLAIIGRPNVGKSSILNALAGEDRVIVSEIPGTTRDAIDMDIVHKGQAFRLIDTAGIRRKGKIQGSIEYYMVLRATRALARADCALVLIDGKDGLTDGDKRVAKISHDLGKPCVFAVNKWDLVEPPTGDLGKRTAIKKDFIRIIREEAPEMSYVPIRFTSAKEETGLDGIMKAVTKAIENWSTRIPTGKLNRIIQDALYEKPLTRKGRTVKVFYATQPEERPPVFVLFCNDTELMHFSYVRFIENRIREEYPMVGTPIRLVTRSSRERD